MSPLSFAMTAILAILSPFLPGFLIVLKTSFWNREQLRLLTLWMSDSYQR